MLDDIEGRADADLRSQSQLAAIVESRRCIHQDEASEVRLQGTARMLIELIWHMPQCWGVGVPWTWAWSRSQTTIPGHEFAATLTSNREQFAIGDCDLCHARSSESSGEVDAYMCMQSRRRALH